MTSPFTHPLSPNERALLALLSVVSLAAAGTAYYGYRELTTLRAELAALSDTTVNLGDNIALATTSLGDSIQEERKHIDAKLNGVQDQVGSITGTVSTLQKLSEIDPELLAKYSKVFFLSDHYAPARLADIPLAYRYTETKPLQVIPEVLPYLTRMLKQAKTDEIPLYVASAYRSFDAQSSLKNAYSVTYGAGTANSFSADQGYSEHQLGTTVDLITTGTGGALTGFDKTAAYSWLLENAYRYGFVLSYPKNNGYYIFEPWHWRFVGVKLATHLHDTEQHFYELDQRTIDTYLVSLFD